MEKEAEGLNQIKLQNLKEEIEALRKGRVQPESQNFSQKSELAEIKEQLGELIRIFQRGAEYVKEGFEKNQAPGISDEAIKQLSDTLNEIRDENALLAKGLMHLTSLIEGLSRKIEELESRPSSGLQELGIFPGLEQEEKSETTAPPPPPPPPRKETLKRYKNEFSK